MNRVKVNKVNCWRCVNCGDIVPDTYKECPHCGDHAPTKMPEAARPCPDRGAPDHGRDMVNHPPHYTQHPSGVECIQITEHYPFNIGNVIKYCWRAGLKNDALEDLKKARFYLDREIQLRETK